MARKRSERGELVVRRRDDGTLELRVNGVFVMDTAETTTERLLAGAALRDVSRPRRVLVGGLGLGFTLRELLADPRVEHVQVAEIEPAVVAWMRDGALPGGDLLDDPRVELHVGDVRDLVTALPPARLDVVLLDVDNGPGYLVHDSNAAIYRLPFMHVCRGALRGGGQLTVWSADAAPDLESDLTAVFGGCVARPLAVDLQGRAEQYWLYSARR